MKKVLIICPYVWFVFQWHTLCVQKSRPFQIRNSFVNAGVEGAGMVGYGGGGARGWLRGVSNKKHRIIYISRDDTHAGTSVFDTNS